MQKTDGARFFWENSNLAKNGQKRPKMTLFQTLTKNGSKDFSDFGPEHEKFWVLGNDPCQSVSPLVSPSVC